MVNPWNREFADDLEHLIRCPTMNSQAPLPVACPECAARMPEAATFCPGCGRSMSPPTADRTKAEQKVGSLPESVAGGFAYVLIPAIIFLFLDPYRRNHFVRFHSIQSVLFWVALLLAGTILKVVGLVLILIPVVGPLLTFVISVVAVLAAFLIWLVLVVKAFQREAFKLPILGDLAGRYAPLSSTPGP